VKDNSTRVINAHLVIPSIGVIAVIEPVGVLPDGNLGVPTHHQWDGVGWYKDGPYPGERGSAVIDGHLDRPGGVPAVFWELRNIHVGDMVMVVDANRKMLHFRVTRVAFYAPQGAPLKSIFADTSGTFLNLITCAGQWIPAQHQTALRLVVYTKLI
jgi:LPXTG-site transpeptidase (sortase) family protein